MASWTSWPPADMDPRDRGEQHLLTHPHDPPGYRAQALRDCPRVSRRHRPRQLPTAASQSVRPPKLWKCVSFNVQSLVASGRLLDIDTQLQTYAWSACKGLAAQPAPNPLTLGTALTSAGTSGAMIANNEVATPPA
mmetsp:Transcript_19144/g.41262  ORF Transcript_19144/g.41262 Transcript_19144/m.41262 type:complete len:136 (-) Transcript_19144:710-1117(-)